MNSVLVSTDHSMCSIGNVSHDYQPAHPALHPKILSSPYVPVAADRQQGGREGTWTATGDRLGGLCDWRDEGEI